MLKHYRCCRSLVVVVLAVLPMQWLLTTPAHSAEPIKVAVFISGTDGYHTFRIPSVIATPKGSLLASCEGRKSNRRDHGDLDLVMKRSTDAGKTWGPLEIIYEEGGDTKITIGNPCPVIDESTGRIWMPFCRNNDDVLVTFSNDDGQTWSKPVEITNDVKKPEWAGTPPDRVSAFNSVTESTRVVW